jgi:LysM repeat protein
MEALLQDKNMKRICVLILMLIWVWSVVGNSSVPGDSVGVKVMDGKTLMVYRVSAGETAYAVSRKYGVPFKDIAAVNAGVDMGGLKAGQEIFVPTNFAATAVTTEPVVVKKEEKTVYPTQEKITPVVATENKEVIVKEAQTNFE